MVQVLALQSSLRRRQGTSRPVLVEVLCNLPGVHGVVTGKDIPRIKAALAIGEGAIDLGDMASVRTCARGFLDRDQPLGVLINNGGLAGSHGMTKDGFELAFGTNHLGHYLLTRLLLPALLLVTGP